MPVVIQADRVSKRYPNGTEALNDVSLRVPPGQLVAVLGPSGSGKTTLFRLCNGTVRATQGTLDVLGVPMAQARGAHLRALRRRVAVVFQNHNLVGTMSVLHNVLVGRLGRVPLATALRSAVFPSEAERRTVYELLDQLGVADKLNSRVDDLSGGQQQRVAIARALLQHPELLLADEPIASVDSETATVILDLLQARCREQGVAILVSLHQRQYVERYCDRLVELRAGRLVRDESLGSPPAVAVSRMRSIEP